MFRHKQKGKNRQTRKRTIIASSVFVILALVVVGIVIKKDSSNTPVTASAYTKGDVGSHPGTVVTSKGTSNTSNSTTGSTNNSDKTSSGGSSGSSTSSTAPLLTPTGDFVSDHEPNLSGSPHPNTMNSVCNTTPGATCYISFTNGDTTKSLSKQQADSGGGTYWNYSLQSVGLTQGTWTIEAIATSNGQTKTAYDAMNLTVSQ
jgi:hypothetical protein